MRRICLLASAVLIAALPLAGVADTNAPGTITADDISLDTDAFHATLKHIAVSGASLSQSDLLALLDVHSSVPASERLAKLFAAHIAIPELVLEIKGPAAQQQGDATTAPKGETITFRDISLDDVKSGRASHADISATSAVIQSAESGEMQVAIGPAHLVNFDLVELATLLSAPAAKDSVAGLCDSLAIEGVKITVPETGSDTGMGGVTLTSIKVHSAAVPSTKDKSATGFGYAYDRFDIASIDFTDMRFQANNGSTSWTGRIGHGLLSNMVADKVAEARFDDFSVTNDSGTIKIGHLGWHAPGGAAPDAQQKMTGDAIDLNLGKLPMGANSGKPVHVFVNHFDVTNDKFIDGKPTQVRAALDHFSFDLAGFADGNFAPVAALGYDKLDLSSQLQARIDPDAHQFTLDALSLSGVDMGMVALSGRFDQVTNGLLSSDQPQLEAALVRVLLHHVEIKIENTGLFDRLIAATAKRDGISEADVRKKFTDAATTAVPALLNHGKGSDQLAAALAKFIAQPKTLRVSVTAPDGISALDALMIKDPAELLDRLTIEAVANQ